VQLRAERKVVLLGQEAIHYARRPRVGKARA
jgi:hypothetical protein